MAVAYVVMQTEPPTNIPAAVFTNLEDLRAYTRAAPGAESALRSSASTDPATLKGKMKNKSYKNNTEFDAEHQFTVYTVLLDPSSPPAPKISFSGGRKKTVRRRRRTTRKH
jgi:hypothetical protein